MLINPCWISFLLICAIVFWTCICILYHDNEMVKLLAICFKSLLCHLILINVSFLLPFFSHNLKTSLPICIAYFRIHHGKTWKYFLFWSRAVCNLVYSMSREVIFLAQKGQAAETGSSFYSWPRYCATFELSQHQLLLGAQNILRNCLGRFIYWLPALLFKRYSVCRDAFPIISFTEHYIPFPFFFILLVFLPCWNVCIWKVNFKLDIAAT